MRILFVTSLYLPWLGGIEVLAAELAQELVDRGHTVAVLTATNTPDLPLGPDQVDGIEVLRIDAFNMHGRPEPIDLLRRRRDVRDFVARVRPTVVHAHDVGAVLSTLQGVVPEPVPLLVTVHNVMSLLEPELIGHYASGLAAADAVSGVSPDVVTDIRSFAPDLAAPLHLVRNGLTSHRTDPLALTDGPGRLLSVGRLVPQKGFDRLLDALPGVLEQQPWTRLAIAGVGPDSDRMRRQARRLGIAGSVDFLGRVERHRVADLMAASTAVVMPSRFEGLPLVALEAALSARPVIASDVPGLRHAIDHEETGLLVPDGDGEALTAAMLRVLSDRDAARRWGAAGRAAVVRDWSLRSCADRYLEIYHQIARAS